MLVLGDSHSEALKGWKPPGWCFDAEAVGGATASGIRNPNSATEALPRFRRRLQALKPWQSVIVMLGEVDVGYIIWRRARTKNIQVEDSLEETVHRYHEFLRTEVTSSEPLMVMSVPLPTLPDDSSQWGEVAQQRADVQVSQRDRTDLTIRFNAAVAAICSREGWVFVDSTSAQFDLATGLIRSDLVRHGTGDHHLAITPYRALIASALEGLSVMKPSLHRRIRGSQRSPGRS